MSKETKPLTTAEKIAMVLLSPIIAVFVTLYLLPRFVHRVFKRVVTQLEEDKLNVENWDKDD